MRLIVINKPDSNLKEMSIEMIYVLYCQPLVVMQRKEYRNIMTSIKYVKLFKFIQQ